MEPNKQDHLDPTRLIHPRRPFLLTLLFWVFVLWSLLGWLRFGRALVERSLIREMVPPGMYWYLLLTGLFCGLGALPVLWGMVRRSDWAPALVCVLAFLYPALYWVERLFLWSDPTAADNWPFMLLLTILWFGLVICALRSKRGRRYFIKIIDEE